jgi:hypothetical protein
MAREIREREDLLRDATALVPRALLRVNLAGADVDVFIGFRGDSLSLYFGDDPVLHFNARGELRRAFIADRLIKAERGRLVAMDRRRSAENVQLLRDEFDPSRQEQLLINATRMLDELRAAIANGQWNLVGQVPDDGDAVARSRTWLDDHREIAVAISPRVDR